MTATERLRQLLDERGVVYSREGCETFFKNVHIWAINDKELCISISGLSPEQAVDATLGRGTCKVVSKPCDMWECECGKAWWHGGAPNYCPSCGRRVEE